MLVIAGSAGGVGCTTVAATLAIYSARRRPTLLVDLGGDGAVLLGAEASEFDLGDWLVAENPPPDALRRIEFVVAEHLSVLTIRNPAVAGAVGADQWEVFAQLLAAEERMVIVDLGPLDRGPLPIRRLAGRLVLVARLCRLALTRMAASSAAVDGLVVVVEPGRLLRVGDVAEAASAPVLAMIRWDPAVSMAIDTGAGALRPPRQLRGLGRLLS